MKGWICLALIAFAFATTGRIREYSLDENQSTMDITVMKKDVFYIKLRGNPTTGYEWELLNVDAVKAIIIPMNIDSAHHSNDVRGDIHPEGYVGGESTFYFKFKVSNKKNPKNAIMRFVYKRSWETTSNDEIKQVNIHIR